MAGEVELRQLDSDGETLDPNDHAGELLHNLVVEPPVDGIEESEDIGAEKNAKEDGERGLRKMKVVPYEEGEESVDYQEAGNGKVGDMGSCRFDLVPHRIYFELSDVRMVLRKEGDRIGSKRISVVHAK